MCVLLLVLAGVLRRSARLSLPLIKTASLLITHADFAGVLVGSSSQENAKPLTDAAAAPTAAATAGAAAVPPSSMGSAATATSGTSKDSEGASSSGSAAGSFAWGVLQLLKQELRGCGDVLKLLEGVGLLAQLACVPGCSGSAIQTVMVMLVNRYPKVGEAAVAVVAAVVVGAAGMMEVVVIRVVVVVVVVPQLCHRIVWEA